MVDDNAHGIGAAGRDTQKDIQRQARICIWVFDEVYWTEDTEEDLREKMKNDGYIEGIEWGIVKTVKGGMYK